MIRRLRCERDAALAERDRKIQQVERLHKKIKMPWWAEDGVILPEQVRQLVTHSPS